MTENKPTVMSAQEDFRRALPFLMPLDFTGGTPAFYDHLAHELAIKGFSSRPEVEQLRKELEEAKVSLEKMTHRAYLAEAYLVEVDGVIERYGIDTVGTGSSPGPGEQSRVDKIVKAAQERYEKRTGSVQIPELGGVHKWAAELLRLYDLRFELAKREEAGEDIRMALRHYGEQKKNGWIALRKALGLPDAR